MEQTRHENFNTEPDSNVPYVALWVPPVPVLHCRKPVTLPSILSLLWVTDGACHLHILPVLASSGFHLPEVSETNQSSLQAILAFRGIQAARLGSAKSALLPGFHSAKLLCPVSF